MHLQAAIIKELTSLGYKVKVKAAGESMGRKFAKSSHIILVDGAPAKGKVVALLSNGKVLIHRIHRITKDKVVTRGDSSNCYDEPADKRQILAIADALCRNGRIQPIKPHHISSRLLSFASAAIRAVLLAL
ncbi:MAG: hypothetical protein Kow0090_23090 [Myxococcota bacterium]